MKGVTLRRCHGLLACFSDSDRQVYMAFLAERCRKFALTVLGYCLMPNHIHLGS